ncbi:tRNA pseudouridine synthase A isoform X3 [Phoenix dactylifera]|uniref:tRNA pseudouridine synthase n=1 Tax=Phoenix dactylifera TaxID=42345 RepID=A0A8B7BPM4_PHODC|nr:tRNA pseudouridine synthase A isoform X3 [Phoenix dactylifera]
MLAHGILRIPAARKVVKRASAMENGKVYIHYNHTDPCRHSRWTARESYRYMYRRPWRKVVDFYSDLVSSGKGASSLSSLLATGKLVPQDITENFHSCEGTCLANIPTKDKTGRWERVTFKIVLSYHGGSFDGWQKQPGLNTVQGLVEKPLGRFVDERKAEKLKDKSLPLEGCAAVAGRTDKGVTALQQVCSFYTWRKDVKCGDIKVSINEAAPGKLKVLTVSEVSRAFHPNFAAKWRRYFYIFPLDDGDGQINHSEMGCSNSADALDEEQINWQPENDEEEQSISLLDGNEDDNMYNIVAKPRNFSVDKVNQLLRQLEGRSLSYKMFARDTKASRSTGPPTECFMFHARATDAKLPYYDKNCVGGLRVMCVELVANRFLRKMVRVLIATAIREAAAGADDDALLKLMDATCRRATAPPAPPEGLCLVDVGYEEFKQENCLILSTGL